MSRAARSFQSVFDDLAVALNFTPAEVAAKATLQAKLLAVFQRAYTRGYNKYLWEDAWTGSEETPVNRVIDYGEIADARRFEVWSADPREPANNAYEVRFCTGSTGITLFADFDSVFVLSMPKAPRFTTTAWLTATIYAVGALVLHTDGHVYVCLTAHTSGTFATDLAASKWAVVPVLDVLADFVTAYARGTYILENGQIESGAALRNDALNELETLAMNECCRAASAAWRPRG